MKKLSSLIFIFILTAMMAANSFATYSSMEFIGFSKDGRYLAFENSDPGGDGGGGALTAYFVDTAKNSYVIPPIILPDDDDDHPAKYKAAARIYDQKLAAAIRKFGIVRGNTGTLAAAHLLTDWSNTKPVDHRHSFIEAGVEKEVEVADYEGALVSRDKSTIEKVIFNTQYDSYLQNTYEYYELTLKASPVEGQTEEPGSNYRMELTLEDRTKHPYPALRYLQKDGPALPKDRSFAYGYKVETVYLYENKIAVFINVFGQGFEETAMDYMVVTGVLDSK